jgi:hypothetical protein
VEDRKQDTIYLQHFATQKMLACPGPGKLMYLTEKRNEILELIVDPVIYNEKILREGSVYHLHTKSRPSTNQKTSTW